MRRLFLYSAVLFLVGQPTHASDEQNVSKHVHRGDFLVGHNLSSTSEVLPASHCTAGLQVFACGLSDKTTIGSSTWMLTDYQMYTGALRHLFSTDETGNRFAGQVSYFQTYTKRRDDNYNYEMKSLWAEGIRTWQLKDDYRLHLNGHINYYFDDRMPFSLRRPAYHRSPWQVNLTALHEISLVSDWYIFGEIGLLDMFNAPLHTHSGVSIGRAGTWYSWHIGYSLSSTLLALFSPRSRNDYQQQILSTPGATYDSQLDKKSVRYDYGIHPEFSMQVYL